MKKAQIDSAQHPKPPLSEMLKSIPATFGIRLNEEPDYEVLEQHGEIEVREYEAMTVAYVTVDSDFEIFANRPFTI